MPLTQADIQDFSHYPPLMKLPLLNLATTGAVIIGGNANQPFYGMNRMVIFAVVLDNPQTVAGVAYGAATASFGSNTGTQNDFAAAATTGTLATPLIIFPPSAAPNGVYAGNTVFAVNVTVAGTGGLTVTVYGSVK